MWQRQHRVSILDSEGICILRVDHPGVVYPLFNCEGDLHEVWIQRSDLWKDKQQPILTSVENLVLVTHKQNMHMTNRMNRECMLYLIAYYGRDKIDKWMGSLSLKLPLSTRSLIGRME